METADHVAILKPILSAGRGEERTIIMLDLFSELFHPPYDVWQVLIILLLLLFAAYTVVFASYLFQRLLVDRKITRFFFAEHSVTTGIVVGYGTIDGHTYTTASPAMPGTSTIYVPRFHQTPEQFTVTLKCRDTGMRFYAEYQIPSSDYKEHKKGQSIRINDDWEGISIEGKSLSNLVICRLPFPVPDPIITYKELVSSNALMKVMVPEM